MSITITHTALDPLGAIAPSATVVITEIDVYGIDVPASSHGPYSTTADADGAWTQAVDGGFMYRVEEVPTTGGVVHHYVDVPASAGPYDIEAILFDLTTVTPGLRLADTVDARAAVATGYAHTAAAYSRGLPGWSFIGYDDTVNINSGKDYGVPFAVTYPIHIIEIATYLVSAASLGLQLGIYNVDSEYQPLDLLFADDITTALTTGGKFDTGSSPDLDLLPGIYALMFNLQSSRTFRLWKGGAPPFTGWVTNNLQGVMDTFLGDSRSYAAFGPTSRWGVTSSGINTNCPVTPILFQWEAIA